MSVGIVCHGYPGERNAKRIVGYMGVLCFSGINDTYVTAKATIGNKKLEGYTLKQLVMNEVEV